MKKLWVLLLCSAFLSGCTAEDTFETVADEWVQSAAAPVREVILELPEDAAAPVSSSGHGSLYQCDGYEIMVETLSAGDLDATIQSVTGYSREELTVLETKMWDVKRYDLVWSCVGEAGEMIGRACVLDDGDYHYVLSVLGEAKRAVEFEPAWNEIFSGYSLG